MILPIDPDLARLTSCTWPAEKRSFHLVPREAAIDVLLVESGSERFHILVLGRRFLRHRVVGFYGLAKLLLIDTQEVPYCPLNRHEAGDVDEHRAMLFGLPPQVADGPRHNEFIEGAVEAGWQVRRRIFALMREASLTRADLPWLAGTVLFGGILGPLLLLFGLALTDATSASLHVIHFICPSLMAASDALKSAFV